MSKCTGVFEHHRLLEKRTLSQHKSTRGSATPTTPTASEPPNMKQVSSEVVAAEPSTVQIKQETYDLVACFVDF